MDKLLKINVSNIVKKEKKNQKTEIVAKEKRKKERKELVIG